MSHSGDRRVALETEASTLPQRLTHFLELRGGVEKVRYVYIVTVSTVDAHIPVFLLCQASGCLYLNRSGASLPLQQSSHMKFDHVTDASYEALFSSL